MKLALNWERRTRDGHRGDRPGHAAPGWDGSGWGTMRWVGRVVGPPPLRYLHPPPAPTGPSLL